MEFLVGKTIDNYRILEVVGRGGMGVVLKALDTSLEKIVALKVIDPFLAKDESFVRRFKTEAKALAKLENPNIVVVHALRETEAGFFMVMEYVESKSLSKHLSENGSFSTKDTIAITKQLLNAIGHAHKVGVIHRDIKPSNILLCDDGKIKVSDFGLAKVVQQKDPSSTVTQARAGTLYYMPPEQVKGLKNVDTRSDIYSLGMTIYEMITGRVPFEKTDSEFAITKKIVDGDIPSPAVYRPDIPKQLLKLILKAIHKDPAKRYQNISEMAESFYQIENQYSDKAAEVNLKTSLNTNERKRTKKKNKILINSVSTVFLIVVVITLYFLFGREGCHEKIIPDISDTTTNNKYSISLANLTIKSNPSGAAVLLDQTPKGYTDLYIDSLESKNYLIALKLKGYEELAFNYKPSPGNNFITKDLVKIVPSPVATLNLMMDEEGYIYIGNKKFSADANKSISQNLSPEKHLVKFVNKNNVIKEATIDLEKQQKKYLTCYFQHVVSIQTLDETGNSIWASLIIDEKKVDKDTPTEITLSAGKHIIYVQRNGYRTLEEPKKIDIPPEFRKKTTPLVFHLKKL